MRWTAAAVSIAVIGLVACGDLFHGTEWESRCERAPSSAGCRPPASASSTGGAAGEGGAGASGGEGGGTGATGGSPDPTFDTVCTDYGLQLCARLAECAPNSFATVGG